MDLFTPVSSRTIGFTVRQYSDSVWTKRISNHQIEGKIGYHVTFYSVLVPEYIIYAADKRKSVSVWLLPSHYFCMCERNCAEKPWFDRRRWILICQTKKSQLPIMRVSREKENFLGSCWCFCCIMRCGWWPWLFFFSVLDRLPDWRWPTLHTLDTE